ncbi:MAG: DoxX family protein [Acidobacteria bacterium]|nr:DoxX family protein [Acidobacteriota bacterium]
MTVARIRSTSNNKLAAGLRLALAVLFLMTGAMKLLVPMLADAWSGQLVAASIPLYTISRWSVPFLEIAVGLALVVGFAVRLAGVVVIGIMSVATYVHLVVDDPSLFPLQPSAPVIPLVVIAVSAYLVWRGAGAWSLDLRTSQRVPAVSGRRTVGPLPEKSHGRSNTD